MSGWQSYQIPWLIGVLKKCSKFAHLVKNNVRMLENNIICFRVSIKDVYKSLHRESLKSAAVWVQMIDSSVTWRVMGLLVRKIWEDWLNASDCPSRLAKVHSLVPPDLPITTDLNVESGWVDLLKLEIALIYAHIPIRKQRNCEKLDI